MAKSTATSKGAVGKGRKRSVAKTDLSEPSKDVEGSKRRRTGNTGTPAAPDTEQEKRPYSRRRQGESKLSEERRLVTERRVTSLMNNIARIFTCPLGLMSWWRQRGGVLEGVEDVMLCLVCSRVIDETHARYRGTPMRKALSYITTVLLRKKPQSDEVPLLQRKNAQSEKDPPLRDESRTYFRTQIRLQNTIAADLAKVLNLGLGVTSTIAAKNSTILVIEDLFVSSRSIIDKGKDRVARMHTAGSLLPRLFIPCMLSSPSIAYAVESVSSVSDGSLDSFVNRVEHIHREWSKLSTNPTIALRKKDDKIVERKGDYIQALYRTITAPLLLKALISVLAKDLEGGGFEKAHRLCSKRLREGEESLRKESSKVQSGTLNDKAINLTGELWVKLTEVLLPLLDAFWEYWQNNIWRNRNDADAMLSSNASSRGDVLSNSFSELHRNTEEANDSVLRRIRDDREAVLKFNDLAKPLIKEGIAGDRISIASELRFI